MNKTFLNTHTYIAQILQLFHYTCIVQLSYLQSIDQFALYFKGMSW